MQKKNKVDIAKTIGLSYHTVTFNLSKKRVISIFLRLWPSPQGGGLLHKQEKSKVDFLLTIGLSYNMVVFTISKKRVKFTFL